MVSFAPPFEHRLTITANKVYNAAEYARVRASYYEVRIPFYDDRENKAQYVSLADVRAYLKPLVDLVNMTEGETPLSRVVPKDPEAWAGFLQSYDDAEIIEIEGEHYQAFPYKTGLKTLIIGEGGLQPAIDTIAAFADYIQCSSAVTAEDVKCFEPFYAIVKNDLQTDKTYGPILANVPVTRRSWKHKGNLGADIVRPTLDPE